MFGYVVLRAGPSLSSWIATVRRPSCHEFAYLNRDLLARLQFLALRARSMDSRWEAQAGGPQSTTGGMRAKSGTRQPLLITSGGIDTKEGQLPLKRSKAFSRPRQAKKPFVV